MRMNYQHIKLLVFDWDGTLADSTSAIVEAMQSAIFELSYSNRSEEDIRNIIGLGLLEAVTTLYPELSDQECTVLADKYRHCYISANRGKTRLFPGTREILETLKTLGYQLAIATGKSRKGLNNSLLDTGLESFFHNTRCADEVCSKPHPQMLLEIMEEIYVKPEQTLMIGDSEYDLQMAANASVRSVAVSYGTQNRERLLKYRPEICLDSMGELIPWLSNGR